MPKRVQVVPPTPSDVDAATAAFGTQLRVHLIRFFSANPGARQAAAVHALGVDRAAVSFNAKVLTDLGVLRPIGDRLYEVDTHRRDQLLAALGEFVHAV